MDKKAHEALERIRKDVTLTTSDMENQDANRDKKTQQQGIYYCYRQSGK